MGIMGYYATQNKKKMLETHISSLKKVIKQQGEKSAFYVLWQSELAKAEEKLKQWRSVHGEE